MSRDMAQLAQLDRLTTALNKAPDAHDLHLTAVLDTVSPDPKRSATAARRAQAHARRAHRLLDPLVRAAD